MSPNKSSHFLYERWLATVSKFGSELALVDLASNERWTFRDLLRDSDKGTNECSSVVFPSGHNAGFVQSILRAWRQGQVTCPIEAGQGNADIPAPPNGIAHLKLTSATTGAAKCIAFTAGQLAADPANIVATMGLRPDWPNLACISLSHSYGFSNFVLPLLFFGIPLVIVPAPLPELLARAAKPFSGVTLASVPALWRAWQESDAIPKNAKLAISAGAPLPIELEQQVFRTAQLKVHNFYGSSECGGIAYDRSELPRTDASYAGSALENVTLSVGEAATLTVESAAVGETYWPQAHPGLRAQRFETADLAEIRPEGVFLRGRRSDLINVAGRKVAPETIEAALRAHPAVTECIVFAIDDLRNDRMDTIVACINARAPLQIRELTRLLSETLPAWQIPRKWWFTAELLPNQRGKISRSEWRKRYLEGKDRAVQSESTLG